VPENAPHPRAMRGFANQRDDLLHTFILHGVSGNLATVVESLNVGRMTRGHHLRAWVRNAPLGLWTHLRGGRMKQGAAPNRRVVVSRIPFSVSVGF